MVDVPLADEPLHRFTYVVRIDPVELQAPRRFIFSELGEHQGLRPAFDQGAGSDHLAHVEARAEAPTQGAKRPIRDTGHRREHHRRPNRERPDLHRRELAGLRQGDIAIELAFVDRIHRRIHPS